jgi:2-keto-4-pentenoate hydratase/2-oxohepta-3-ene-1,7-dioic acid hydratase in catechol pathway
MRVAWSRLIRFVAIDGRVLRGEPILPNPDFDLGKTTVDTKLQAKVIVGDNLFDDTGATRVSDEVVTVKKLLGPLTPGDVDILRCVGLNYAKHSTAYIFPLALDILANFSRVREAGRNPPPFPFIFFKPTTCLYDHGEDVVIPRIAQDDQADYEGELVLVIGKDAKDVLLQDALDYVAAYTAGNDVSARKLQRDPKLAGGIPQWGFSKGFDTFAPIGPALVASCFTFYF